MVLNPGMELIANHFFHVGCLLVLTALSFAAFANPDPKWKRFVMMGTGLASLIMLITGIRMMLLIQSGMPGWIIVKLLCWLGINGLVVVAFRKPDKAVPLGTSAFLLLLIGVAMVYFKPF